MAIKYEQKRHSLINVVYGQNKNKHTADIILNGEVTKALPRDKTSVSPLGTSLQH